MRLTDEYVPNSEVCLTSGLYGMVSVHSKASFLTNLHRVADLAVYFK